MKRIRQNWRDSQGRRIHPTAARQIVQDRWRLVHLMEVFRTGKVTDVKKEQGQWRYTVEGKNLDGRKMVCKVELDGKRVTVRAVR